MEQGVRAWQSRQTRGPPCRSRHEYLTPGLETQLRAASLARLETQGLSGKYLLYSPTPEPEPDTDWLLDIRLYRHTFRADRASIVLAELGLNRQSLRGHLADRAVFFRSKERLERLQRMVVPDDDERPLGLKMLAVLTRAESPDLFSLLMRLAREFVGEDGIDTKLPPQAETWCRAAGRRAAGEARVRSGETTLSPDRGDQNTGRVLVAAWYDPHAAPKTWKDIESMSLAPGVW